MEIGYIYIDTKVFAAIAIAVIIIATMKALTKISKEK